MENNANPNNRTTIAILSAVGIFLALNVVLVATGKVELNWAGFGVIVAAGLTLAMYSFLYKDNPVFKFAEHMYVGVSLGYFITQVIFDQLIPDLFTPLFNSGDKPTKWILIIPFFLGVLMFSRFIPKIAWLSRWSIAFLVGYGAGVAIPNMIKANILQQAKSSMISVGTPWATICGLIALLGVVFVLLYFFFSLEHKGGIGKISRIGVMFLMIAFGASFGLTVMARISLLIGRISFLLKDWLHVMN